MACRMRASRLKLAKVGLPSVATVASPTSGVIASGTSSELSLRFILVSNGRFVVNEAVPERKQQARHELSEAAPPEEILPNAGGEAKSSRLGRLLSEFARFGRPTNSDPTLTSRHTGGPKGPALCLRSHLAPAPFKLRCRLQVFLGCQSTRRRSLSFSTTLDHQSLSPSTPLEYWMRDHCSTLFRCAVTHRFWKTHEIKEGTIISQLLKRNASYLDSESMPTPAERNS